jgi:O-antigen/teichoic acid export membrane protein
MGTRTKESSAKIRAMRPSPPSPAEGEVDAQAAEPLGLLERAGLPGHQGWVGRWLTWVRADLAKGGERAVSSSLARRAASGALWNTLGACISRGLALVAAILVARQLGVVAFGEYNLVQTTAGMFQVLAGFGLGATATKCLSGSYRLDREAAGRIVALSWLVSIFVGTLATLAMALVGPWLASGVLGAAQLGVSLQLGSLMLLSGSVVGAQFGVLAGLERFRLLAMVSGIGAFVSIPLTVLGARLGGTKGGVLGLVVSGAMIAALQGAAVRAAMRSAGVRPRYASAFREWRILLSLSIPTTLSNLLVTPVTWLASAIMVRQEGGWGELGLFFAANQWRNAIVLVALSACAALFPVFSDLYDTGRARDLSRAFWTSFATIGGVALVAALVLSAAASVLMRAYGAEFIRATHVVTLLVATGAISAPLTVITCAILGAGRMWLGFVLTLASACALLALTWVLRGRGATGLSSAYLLSSLVHLTLGLACMPRILRPDAPAEAPCPR